MVRYGTNMHDGCSKASVYMPNSTSWYAPYPSWHTWVTRSNHWSLHVKLVTEVMLVVVLGLIRYRSKYNWWKIACVVSTVRLRCSTRHFLGEQHTRIAAVQFYGHEALQEGLPYHFQRMYHRHNYSMYWYWIYLSRGRVEAAAATSTSTSSMYVNHIPTVLQFCILG